jgi:hypothetical protein
LNIDRVSVCWLNIDTPNLAIKLFVVTCKRKMVTIRTKLMKKKYLLNLNGIEMRGNKV